MKKFSIEKAKQGYPICTRKGLDVRILAYNMKNKDDFLLIGLIEDGEDEHISTWDEYGNSYQSRHDDLFMKSEKREGWINIYKVSGEYYTGNRVYDTKEDAQYKLEDHVNTIKIEWEE